MGAAYDRARTAAESPGAPLKSTMTVAEARRTRSRGPRALAAAVVLFVSGSIPYCEARATVPHDRVYTGLAFDVPDHAQYWSWVTASRPGLFISDTMTPEPNAAIFMNPMMWLLARVQDAFGLSFPALLQPWRWPPCRCWRPRSRGPSACSSTIRPAAGRPRGSRCSAAGSDGCSWRRSTPRACRTRRIRTTSTSSSPTPSSRRRSTRTSRWRRRSCSPSSQPRGMRTGRAAVAPPRSRWPAPSPCRCRIPTTSSPSTPSWGRRGGAVSPGAPRLIRLTWIGAAIAGTSGPIAFFYRQLTASDPLWREVLAQYANAGVWTPPHVHLVILMGLPLLLALAGLSRARAGGVRHAARRLARVRAGARVPARRVPDQDAHRLAVPDRGPCCVRLARRRVATARRGAAARLDGAARERRRGPALLLLVVPTNVYLLLWRVTELARHERPFFLHRDEADALEWLAAHAGRERRGARPDARRPVRSELRPDARLSRALGDDDALL